MTSNETKNRAFWITTRKHRYRPMSQTAVAQRDPRELLDELAAIEAEIVEEVEELRSALSKMPI
jgi:type I restriction enzyme M protein